MIPGQIESEQSPTTKTEGQTLTPKSQPKRKAGQTKTKKSPTATDTHAPEKATADATKWTLKGIDIETRNTITKAAQRAGKPLGKFFNQEIREFCNGQLSRKAEVPAAPADVAGMVKAELATVGEEMEARIIGRIEALLGQQHQQPKSFWARMFGK
jgi:hypothetical protein